MNKTWTKLLAVAAGLTVAVGAASAQTAIRPEIAFDPYGAGGDPFSWIPAAVCETGPGETLTFAPGVYRQTMFVGTPMMLRKGAGAGSAIVTGPAPVRTTLRVASWNLHLFGSFPLPAWQDETRAERIGDYVNGLRIQGQLDFIGVQELWASPENSIVLDRSNMSFFHYGDDNEGSSALNSGLMLLSQHPISNRVQAFFADERGTDASSSKGWIQQTITKDGFSIGVFNTHTQSGDSEEDSNVRVNQLFQMANAVLVYRITYPSHPVIVMGDFNIAAGSTVALTDLRFKMGFNTTTGENRQLGDIAPNMGPCEGEFGDCTSCGDNALHTYFYGPGSGAGRIDYIFYGDSRDGTVKVTPRSYDVRRPITSPAISGDGFAPEGCGICSITTGVLSDHDAVFATLELQRN